jgi:phage host-nuclease inhibitor protein Gam
MKIESFEQVNNALHELGKHENFIAKKEAEMNKKLEDIKAQYETATSESSMIAASLRNDIAAFMGKNKNDFRIKRSIKLLHGTIGFRTGQHKLSLLNQKHSWTTVMDGLASFMKGKYVATKVTIDKASLLKDYKKSSITDAFLAQFGLKVNKAEMPFIEPTFTPLED